MNAFSKLVTRFAAPAEPLGIENLTLVFANTITVAKDLAKQLANGFQYTDIFGLLQDFPLIEQITKVAPTAFAELRDLTPTEASQLAENVSKLTGLPNDGTIFGKVKTALALLARTYKVADDAKVILHEWQNLFAAQPELA